MQPLAAFSFWVKMRLTDIFEVHTEALLSELEMSHRDLQDYLRAALKGLHPSERTYIWPRDVYDDYLVYQLETEGTEKLIKRSFAIVDGEVTFGDPVEVLAVTQYVPASADMSTEAALDLTGDLVPLVEKAVKADGTATIRIISPGQGSSGYYPADVLQRDGPKVFTAGTHVYMDHPSISEEKDRPERSVKDLAGSLTGPAEWKEDGLYAPVKFVDSVAPHINDIASISGMSIRAAGKIGTREVDGKKVTSVESIDVAHSVDVVTRAGANGKVMDLIEAARSGVSPAPVSTPEVDPVDKEAFEKAQTDLAEAQQKIADLEAKQTAQEAREAEAALLRESHGVVTQTLAGITLPTATRERLISQLTLNAPVKDGALDRDALIAKVTEAARAETAYLASVTGSAAVQGMGGETPKPTDAPTLEESDKRIAEALAAL